MRLLYESATWTRSPATATPRGPSNRPVAVPLPPQLRENAYRGIAARIDVAWASDPSDIATRSVFRRDRTMSNIPPPATRVTRNFLSPYHLITPPPSSKRLQEAPIAPAFDTLRCHHLIPGDAFTFDRTRDDGRHVASRE